MLINNGYLYFDITKEKSMSVKIIIKGNNDTNEYKYALRLKDIFETDLHSTKTSGEILIICNATLFGQEVKDIDLIVLCNLNYCSLSVKTKVKTSNKKELEEETRSVYINNFCFVI